MHEWLDQVAAKRWNMRGVLLGMALCLSACEVDPEHRRPTQQTAQSGQAIAAPAAPATRGAPTAPPDSQAAASAYNENASGEAGVRQDSITSGAVSQEAAPLAPLTTLPDEHAATRSEESMDDHADKPALPPEALDILLGHGWMDRVVSSLGVWVCVDTQMLYVLEGLEPVWKTRIATASAGTGSTANSYQTPLGWHHVSEKFGDDAPWGQVFRARAATSEIWQPGDDTEEDLVLTRILWLEGEEPGKNQGHNDAGQLVDSKRRYIYIHGTNGEADIGTPSSHGCIRMYNDDVIEIYDMLPLGTPVLITETP